MNALSLFSGIGGIDLACDWAGIKTVAMCEREPFCQKVLHKHWPDVPIYDDVCTLTKERLEADGIGTIDLIHGGYPCQPFSVAGHREGEDDDRHLWPEVFRLIQAVQPRWFVGENVAGHVTLGIDLVLSDLDSVGYSWESFVIPAAAVNAPHRRERVFIVAHPNSIGCLEYKGLAEKIQQSYEQELQREKSKEPIMQQPIYSGDEDVPDTNDKRLQRSAKTRNAGISRTQTKQQFAGHDQSGRGWSVEPDVGRVANGVPQRVDRLKALGNAVVPQQIYPILAAIKQIDDMLRTA